MEAVQTMPPVRMKIMTTVLNASVKKAMKIVIRYLKKIDGDLYMFLSETILFSCEDCIRSVMFSNE